MKIQFNKPTIYLSHSMRGDGTVSIQENCRRASKVEEKICRIFPEIGIYCPGSHDLSLQVLWDAKKITVEDIMYADLEILRACSGWMWWETGPSVGCEQEWEEAIKMNFTKDLIHYPIEIIPTDLLKANYGEVRRLLTPIVENSKKRFKESLNV